VVNGEMPLRRLKLSVYEIVTPRGGGGGEEEVLLVPQEGLSCKE
jgi:hypothetical protein